MPILPGDVLVRAVMTGSTQLAQDRYVNDFAFRFGNGSVAPTIAQLTALGPCVDQFYNATLPGGDKLGLFISNAVSRSVTHEFEFYRLSQGGSPVLSIPWIGPVSPIANTNLPTEVAAVLAFHADLTGEQEEVGTTRPRARRRGRVYIGPLTTQAIALNDPNPRLSAGLTQAMRQAAIVMHDLAAAQQFDWSVWSRKDATLRPVVGGWTDNAPDTQRRRGIASSARVTYSI